MDSPHYRGILFCKAPKNLREGILPTRKGGNPWEIFIYSTFFWAANKGGPSQNWAKISNEQVEKKSYQKDEICK